MDTTSSFKFVFCPAKYGWNEALALNCMKFLKEDEEEVSGRMDETRGNGRFTSQFTEITGTERDADALSRHFMLCPDIITLLIREDSDTGVVGKPLKDALFGDEEFSRRSLSNNDVSRKIWLLRKSLYFSARNTAFLSGRHERLGNESQVRVLSSDVCALILSLSMKP
jgi:hypothetical protein